MKVARAIYYTLESLPPKKKMVQRVAELRGDPEIDGIIKKLADAVQKAHNPRNDLAHSTLVRAPDGTTHRHSQKYGVKKATEGFLQDKLDASTSALEECKRAHGQLCKKLNTKPQLYH